MSSLSSGVTVALRLAGFEARSGTRPLGPGHLLLALSLLSERSLAQRIEDPQRREELAADGERLRERFAEAGINPDDLRRGLRAAMAEDAVGIGVSSRDYALMRTMRRAGELGRGGPAGVVDLLRAILEQPLPRGQEVFEGLGVEDPLFAFFPELAAESGQDPQVVEAVDDLVDADTLDETEETEQSEKPDETKESGRSADGADASADRPAAHAKPIRPDEFAQSPLRRSRRGTQSRTPLLDRYGRDLTLLAREGSLPPLIGREEEMLSIARVLVRQRKANAVLVGEAGVGKTGIVEGLAARLAVHDAAPGSGSAAQGSATRRSGTAAARAAAGSSAREPFSFERTRIVQLAMSGLVAGTKYRGEFEDRMEAVLKEARETPGVILFIDELHTVLGAGGTGASDAANILKPMLARGEIRVIGATTPSEYQSTIEEDPALRRRFAVVWVEEPTRPEAVQILEGIGPAMARHHGIEFAPDAAATAVELAIRYLPDERLPDKAIDLLDQACAATRIVALPELPPVTPIPEAVVAAESAATAGSAEAELDPEPAAPAVVGRAELAAVVAERTRIPVERVAVSEAQRLLGLEASLERRVIGQERAVRAVSEAVRVGRAGLGDPRRPVGVFLLAGPTGSGKTELAKALAEFLFDDEQRLIRIDMSEYQERHAVSRLLGAPPGYLGHDREGQLSGPLRAHPHSVVLFDEVEKAHPEVLDVFLQIFDEGRLTDGRGRRVSFTESVVMLTTNLGSERVADGGFGFTGNGSAAAAPSAGPGRILAELRRMLRPELLGRVGDVIVFDPLSPAALEAVLDKLLARVHARLADRRLRLELTPEARALLLREGTDARAGARALEHAVEHHLVQPLGRSLLADGYPEGSAVSVEVEGGALRFAAGRVGTSGETSAG